MGFTQSLITSVDPPVYLGSEVYLSWQATAVAGTWFQIYINGSLAEWTQQTWAYIPSPSVGTTDRIDIGSVGAGQELVDFGQTIPWDTRPWDASAWDLTPQLPAAPSRRVTLDWIGGYFESPDLAGFFVFGPPAPGHPVDFTRPLATIAAYPGGIDTSGWDLGPWDVVPWGGSPSYYSWTSGTLASGTWTFAVVPFDSAGNQGTASTITETITAPPAEPALLPGGLTRLAYDVLGWDELPWDTSPWSYPVVTLTWAASPG